MNLKCVRQVIFWKTNNSLITCKLWRLSYNWSILDAPSRRHWTLSFFKDHAMASCPKEHPSLSARAHTSRNLSEYFRVSSSADLSFHAYSCVAKTIVSVLRNKCIVYELYLRIIMTFFVKLSFNVIKTTRVMALRFV